jgi:membrane fusion protein, multidrug efflux system
MEPTPSDGGAMKRRTDWLLFLLALAAVALGAAAQLGLFHAPAPPLAFGAAAAAVALLILIRALPLRSRRPVVFLVALAFLVALIGGVAYFQFAVKPNIIKGAISAAFAPKPTTVSAEAATIEKWTPQLAAIGTLRAFEGVIIAPQAAGVVTAKHFESGDDVEAGALLINIDDSVERADLANGLAQLRNAEATLTRQKLLVLQGNTPQATVDAAIAARDSAEATVERTRAVIAQKAIRAPFPGRLGLRNVDLGQYVPVGMAMVSLQRLDPIYADFSVPEDALSSLAPGQEASMTVDAFPGRAFNGKVEAIDARVNAESRNVIARAEFANPDRRLLPGMFANVTVTTGAGADVLTLPRTAIVYSLYGDSVFVVKPAPQKAGEAAAATQGPGGDNGFIVERRFVRVGPVRGERVAIEEGIKPGERVVTSGQVKLQANTPVILDETIALPPPTETSKP